MSLVTVKPKFQVTIPAKLRRGLDLREGDVMEATVLARISHQPPAADADASALRGRAPSSRFDVPSSTPASTSGPRGHAGRRLDALATNVGEICGLGDGILLRPKDVVDRGAAAARVAAALDAIERTPEDARRSEDEIMADIIADIAEARMARRVADG